ncbi:Protein CBG21311 [Caenorhabditis briggsae]|uniref:Protein CBG21311 n=1 Tax=Caenorhabditis briggsae TaxID=6238 RepID=A8XZT3_CAEBR|nr:Protein CBG21311 [Caenorhabditis briggsae]CAP38150.1 Protein CBG21311 [Caenorhabditis briggsae]
MEIRIERFFQQELGKISILRAANRRAVAMPLLETDDGFDYCSNAIHLFFPYL